MLIRSVMRFKNAYHKQDKIYFGSNCFIYIFGFVTSILKSMVILLIWLAFIANRTTFCTKSHLFPCQRRSPTKIQQTIRFQGLSTETSQTVRKWKNNFGNFLRTSWLLDQLCDFKMDVIKWYLNWVSNLHSASSKPLYANAPTTLCGGPLPDCI